MAQITPMRKQYLRIKRQYPDAIVFFRLGDFYETFDDDAKIVAGVCDIVLTSRPVGKEHRVPLAGVPYHSVDTYIAKLINAGYKVAICEQVGEVPARGLVRREVRRVVTPGTVVEPGLLDEKRNNYLAALVVEGNRAGIAYADITTGEFAATQIAGDDVERLVAEELERLRPAELVVGDQGAGSESPVAGCPVTPYEAWRFELDNARRALLDHFEVATLDGFGCQGQPLAVRAAGAVIQYLQETQKAALSQLIGLAVYSTSAFMTLDAATRRNLELTETIRDRSVHGSLLGVLDATQTAMGGRLLRQWLNQPLLDLDRLNRRLDAVEAFYRDTPTRTEIIALLKGLADLERLANRVVQGIALPRDLLSIRKSLEVVPPLRAALEGGEGPGAAASPLGELIAQLDPCPETVTLIAQAIADDAPATLSTGGVIRPGFSAELDDVAVSARDAKQWVADLERSERKRTGIKNLKVGYNKVFGYYIEVTKANTALVPEEYIRKQTLVNAERYITPELKEYESLILNAQERILDLEGRIFRHVCDQVAAAAGRMLDTARALARLDVCAALAEVALRNRYVRPVLTEDRALDIVAGRHPVVELVQRDEPFVPNDIRLGSDDDDIIILTGPNMSGKSTFIRQVALITLMAQIGSFVPADRATIGLVDRIFTRIGAQDEIAAGQSTFMVEMVETANILANATPRSLIILDEVGRGTSTYDGLAIARAVVEYIHNNPRLGAKTLFATHFHELVELANYLPRVRNYNVAVAEEGDRVVFLHKIVPGGADRSYGLHVAQLAGIPKAVVNRAAEVLAELEENSQLREKRERVRKTFAVQQLSFLGTELHPVVEKLRQLKVEEMSPLEAINALYQLRQEAEE